MFLLIFSLIGCSSEIERDRFAKDRSSLPVAAMQHLPDHGLVLISNGYNRNPERIIADLSRARLKWIVPNSKTLSVWSKEKENIKQLSRGESHLLLQQWEAAFIEEPRLIQNTEVERYDEILILVEGSKTRTIRSRGPIQQEKSKSIIETVRLYANEASLSATE